MLASCPLSTSIFRMKKKKITETSVFFSHRLFSFASSACYMHQNGLGPDCSLQPVPTQAKKKLVLWLECSAAFSSCECGVTHPSEETRKSGSPSTDSWSVPKGSVLGQLLFLAFVKDLPNGIQSNIRLYSDDCMLYYAVKKFNDSCVLQADLFEI